MTQSTYTYSMLRHACHFRGIVQEVQGDRKRVSSGDSGEVAKSKVWERGGRDERKGRMREGMAQVNGR